MKKQMKNNKKDKPEEEEELEKEELEEEEEEESETGSEEEADDGEDEFSTMSPKELAAKVRKLQQTVSRVNRESASRRLRIRELEAQINTEDDEDEDEETDEDVKHVSKSKSKTKSRSVDTRRSSKSEVQLRLEAAERELREMKTSKTLSAAARALNVKFASDQAREDAMEFAVAELDEEDYDEDGQVDPDRAKEVVRKVIKSRSYLVTKRDSMETDSNKRGTSLKELSLDEDEIATSFGIRH
jgi:hypothetical protein